MVLADPESVDPFVVYADKLQHAGDPHGELIALELAGSSDPRMEAMRREVMRVPKPRVDASIAVGSSHLGFARDVSIDIRISPSTPPAEVGEFLKSIMEHGPFRLATELSLRLEGVAADRMNPAIEAAMSVARPLLRTLRIHASDRERLHMTWIARCFPNLRQLSLHALSVRIDQLESLETMALMVRGFGDVRIQELLSRNWPKLRMLTIDVRGILNAQPLLTQIPASVTQLGLRWVSHEQINAMIEGGLAQRLTYLRISRCTESALVALSRTPTQFPKLETLELDRPPHAREAAILASRGVRVIVVPTN